MVWCKMFDIDMLLWYTIFFSSFQLIELNYKLSQIRIKCLLWALIFFFFFVLDEQGRNNDDKLF